MRLAADVTEMFGSEEYFIVTVLGAVHVYDVYTFDELFVVPGM